MSRRREVLMYDQGMTAGIGMVVAKLAEAAEEQGPLSADFLQKFLVHYHILKARGR